VKVKLFVKCSTMKKYSKVIYQNITKCALVLNISFVIGIEFGCTRTIALSS
jgi:hypothetical protein